MNAPERCSSGERQFDYCLWEYPPLGDPQGKLRSVNLLYQSFAAAGLGERALGLVAALRAGLGESRTVWCVKQDAGVPSWELYFYDYERLQRTRSMTRVLELVRPWIRCNILPREQREYFMFSFDITAQVLAGERPLESLQMYVGNVGSTVSSGICYALTEEAIRLKNFYFFFDARSQMQQIVNKLTSSAYLDLDGFDPGSILWPELRQCQTIVLANKQTHDGIYFSRVTLAQLLLFMRRLNYPEATQEYVRKNGSQLDHMLYDVGFDYRMENGVLQILKSAYYGVF